MKKVISILLAIIMLFTMVPATVFAAENIEVEIVSFMRGAQTDLRSSELLEARVTGYNGNVLELTYKWTTTLGTYLYVYNSHNMYGINNTDGEVEVYYDEKLDTVGNMEGRNYADSFSGKGYAWASVYGADLSNLNSSRNNSLVGTVTVEVYDTNGKKLCSDTHTGTFSNRKLTGFVKHNLDADLDNVVIGLFEGEKINALDLLGRSGVVHITCTASSVTKAVPLSGGDHIEVIEEELGRNTYNYYIHGVKAGDSKTEGDAKLQIEVSKGYCKFHQDTKGNAEPIVFVFKKPKTATTTTTLTLDKNSIDGRCKYFIDGVEGKEVDGNIVFTGLTPNTDYTVEVRAEYTDNGETKYVYGYVDDTTKPVYSAKIYTYLDGALTDFENIYGEGTELRVRENNDYSDYVALNKTSTGVYEAPLYNAIFNPWCKDGDEYSKIGNYQLVIEHANAELHLHHYTVSYDTNGGAFKAGEEVDTAVYSNMTAVDATSNVPVRDGFIFTGWEYNGKVIASGKQVTSAISAPITLKAKWEKAVNVTINVTIDHNSKVDTGFDQVDSKAEVFVKLLEKKAGSPGFVEIGDKLYFTKDGVTDINGNKKSYAYSIENNVSTYTATADTYTGLLDTSSFDVAVSKTDYDVTKVEKVIDENDDCTINVFLEYNPGNFDLKFSLEMAKGVPVEAYPDAAIVKVAFWNGSAWEIITQQAGADRPGTRVNIDPDTGKGSGSYPVWKFADDDEPYGNRIVVTGFIYGDSVITAPVESIDGLIATYSDGYYTATMTDVTDGKKYGEQLYGAYYDKDTDGQKGTLHGVISVEKYDVIFDANGGTIKGGNTYTEKDEYYVPDTNDYVPTFDGHEFGGWYKDPDFKEPATTGELLTTDITLYAKWDRVLAGNVRVAGSYLQDGNIVNVWDVDRAATAVVALKEITAAGSYTVDSQTVKIDWPTKATMIYGVSEQYRFTGLDPAKEYRTEVLILNYGTTYQNSTTEFVVDENYADDYNDTDFNAVYPESSKWETFVNAYLSFEPASYFQPVEVDATLIGKGSRPDETLVEIWYKATGTENAYQVISQHTVVPYGIEVDMKNDGTDNGDYGYKVWNSVYDGALYDYQAHLSKIDGDAAAEWPVTVVYGAPSRYSPINDAPTGVLQVKLIPNTYNIIYHENYVVDETNVVSYGSHTWSYETAVDYVPVRDGYVFEGWYSNPGFSGEKVTEIDAAVAEDTHLYARWEARRDLELTVKHVDINTGDILDTVFTNETFGETIKSADRKKTFEGYTYESADPESITIDNDSTKNIVTLYYTPNKYDYTVNYLEKGTDKVLATAKTATADYGTEVTEVALIIDGYAITGKSVQTIEIDTENNVINFYYEARSFEYTVNYLEEGTNKVLATAKTATATYDEQITETAVKIDGYTLIGDNEQFITINTESNVINFYYAADTIGGGNDGDDSDNIPDKYQKKIIFKIVNGTWSDDKTADIVKVVTLMKDGKYSADGTAALKAPTGMKADDGFKNGTWDAEIPATVSGTETLTFIYTFIRSTTPVEPLDEVSYIVEHYKENADGTYSLVEEDSEFIAGKIGDAVTATAKTYKDYCLNEAKSEATASGVLKAISSAEDVLVLRLYYDIDTIGGGNDGDDSDNIPDKYQKKIIFKVVNGTWSNGNADDIVKVVTLMKDGEYSADGEAAISVPTEMKANVGYDDGSWDITPAVNVNADSPEVYTFSFTKLATYTVKYLEDGTDKVLAAAATKSALYDSKVNSSDEVIAIDNYAFVRADKDYLTVSVYEDKNVINLYYAPDLTGGGADFDEPDGIADKFQKKVVYKVVNGTWSDGTSEDIVQVVTLMKDGEYSVNGTADVKVPTGMLANEGYGNGSWNVRPSLTVSGTNTETYIYTFTELPEGGNGSGDGSGEGDGSGNGSVDVEDYIVFGKTDGIGWYRVSKDGGQTWETVFGNSHYEVEWGTELTISVGDLMGDAFIFYVNGEAVQPDENGYLVITVTGYTLIGALGYKVETPDTEESLNWFQKIIKAIREFFERLFGKR